jgi:hypothetical protein
MLTLTGKQTGSYRDSLIEIPDGKWTTIFNTNRENSQTIAIEPLPVEFLTNTSAESRDKLRKYLCTHRFATLSLTPVTVTRHIGVPLKKRQRKVYDSCGDCTSHEPNFKELFVADSPFLLFYIGAWSEEAYPGSSTFATARMVNAEKKKNLPDVPQPIFTRGAHGWNWTTMSDLASTLKLDPLVLWNFYFHIAIGADWVSTIDDRYGLVYALGDTPRHTYKTVEVDFIEKPPIPIPDWSLPSDSDFLKIVFSHIEWDKIWIPATWAMRVCYLHHFGMKPVS